MSKKEIFQELLEELGKRKPKLKPVVQVGDVIEIPGISGEYKIVKTDGHEVIVLELIKRDKKKK